MIYYFLVGEGNLDDLSGLPNADTSTVEKVIKALQQSCKFDEIELRQGNIWIPANCYAPQQPPPKDSQNRIIAKLRRGSFLLGFVVVLVPVCNGSVTKVTICFVFNAFSSVL